MSQETMEGFRCWSAETVADTVFSDIGALASDADAIFLAAHTPVTLDRKKGTEVDVAASGEAQVLKALLGPIGDTNRNTLIAVTGESGSGKSHVVRWVNAHVKRDDERFRVLYVPRAIQTLRALLHRIVTDLPGVEGTDLLDRVDAAIGKSSPGELKDRLVNEMCLALNWTIQEQPPGEAETPDEAQAREERNGLLGIPDDQGRRRDGLADLLGEPLVSKALLRPGGRLDRLVASYFDETSRRDDSEEAFGDEDLPIRAPGIRRSLAARPDMAELWDMVTHNPADALLLLEDALRKAVPATLGLRSTSGGDTLDGLFRRSREILKAEGRELVLIFEDLTQFGLVDGELYDQFATAPSKDIAPLRVVFAVTDGAFARMDKTVSTRVTDVFEVGGSALSDPQKFVGRYLNLVRVGGPRTQQLWNSAGHDSSKPWMQNACLTRNEGLPCEFLEKCHESFGKVKIDDLGDVGLYPYSAAALRRAVDHLGHEGTPRLVLDECISTNLTEADARIADGTFPHDRIDDRFDRRNTIGRQVLIQDVPNLSKPEEDRLYRARVIWGDEKGLPKGIEEAFALPRAGTEVVVVPPQPDTPQPERLGPHPLEPLYQWERGDLFADDEANYYRNTLLAMVESRLQLDQSLVHVYSGRGRAVLAGLFNQTSFFFEGARGAGAGKDSVRFDLKPTPENVRLLIAARWFREHGHFDPEQGNWPWPVGRDAQELMVELETQLDTWAATVRRRFLETCGGSAVAGDAVGLRAVALLAVGHDARALCSTDRVLNCDSRPVGSVSDAWADVQSAANQALGLKTDEYVAEFAAVRQGAKGGPQLIDTLELEAALSRWLADPESSLTRVQHEGESGLALQAKNLLEQLRKCEAGERTEIESASVILDDNLEGLAPSTVGDRALQIGDSAKNTGLFRPADAWGQFKRAIDVLETHTSAVKAPVVAPGVAGVLSAQHVARPLILLSKAVTFVVKCIGQTGEECKRVGGTAGSVSELRDEVRAQVGQLNILVNQLARKD